MPALCPRLKVHSLEQALTDIEALAELGAESVLLDTYAGDPEETLHPERSWELLAQKGRLFRSS